MCESEYGSPDSHRNFVLFSHFDILFIHKNVVLNAIFVSIRREQINWWNLNSITTTGFNLFSFSFFFPSTEWNAVKYRSVDGDGVCCHALAFRSPSSGLWVVYVLCVFRTFRLYFVYFCVFSVEWLWLFSTHSVSMRFVTVVTICWMCTSAGTELYVYFPRNVTASTGSRTYNDDYDHNNHHNVEDFRYQKMLGVKCHTNVKTLTLAIGWCLTYDNGNGVSVCTVTTFRRKHKINSMHSHTNTKASERVTKFTTRTH